MKNEKRDDFVDDNNETDAQCAWVEWSERENQSEKGEPNENAPGAKAFKRNERMMKEKRREK